MVPYTVVRSPPSIAATFRPSGLLQVGRSAVLHRLMDREALMLCHPSHCKSSIAYSQALRMRRICSRPTDYHRHVEELKENLIKRGHDGERVILGIERATGVSREQSLTPRTKESAQVTPLVVTFHPDLPHLTRILRDHQCIIDISPRLKGALPNVWGSPCSISPPSKFKGHLG